MTRVFCDYRSVRMTRSRLCLMEPFSTVREDGRQQAAKLPALVNVDGAAPDADRSGDLDTALIGPAPLPLPAQSPQGLASACPNRVLRQVAVPLLARSRIVLLLQLPHMLSGGAVPSRLITGCGSPGWPRRSGTYPGSGGAGEQHKSRGPGSPDLGILQIVRRLPHEADMLHCPSLRRVQDHRGNTGRAFVGRRTINAPGFEQRPRGGSVHQAVTRTGRV